MTLPIIFGLEWECAVGSKNPEVDAIDSTQAFLLLRNALAQLSPWLPDTDRLGALFTLGFCF